MLSVKFDAEHRCVSYSSAGVYGMSSGSYEVDDAAVERFIAGLKSCHPEVRMFPEDETEITEICTDVPHTHLYIRTGNPGCSITDDDYDGPDMSDLFFPMIPQEGRERDRNWNESLRAGDDE